MSAASRRFWRLAYMRTIQAAALAICVAWVALIFQIGGAAWTLMRPSPAQMAQVVR